MVKFFQYFKMLLAENQVSDYIVEDIPSNHQWNWGWGFFSNPIISLDAVLDSKLFLNRCNFFYRWLKHFLCKHPYLFISAVINNNNNMALKAANHKSFFNNSMQNFLQNIITVAYVFRILFAQVFDISTHIKLFYECDNLIGRMLVY